MRRPTGIAFLLSQLGAHVSTRFAERVADLDLSPAHVGVLRVVGQTPGLSQQELARRMDALPSKIVRLVDELEERGLVERRRREADRRHYELHVADGAQDEVGRVLDAVRAHDAEVTRGLTPAERQELARLLGVLAAHQGLNDQAHPSYAARRTRKPLS